jgi:hypothetical protein
MLILISTELVLTNVIEFLVQCYILIDLCFDYSFADLRRAQNHFKFVRLVSIIVFYIKDYGIHPISGIYFLEILFKEIK